MGAIVVLTPEELEGIIIRAVSKALSQRPEQAPGEAKQMLTKQQAADLLSVHPSTIDLARRAKRLTSHYIGTSLRLDRDEVLKLAK